MVLEIPAAGDSPIVGSVMDCWQTALDDVGLAGADQGAGGKYLILPPGYPGPVPDGYIPFLEDQRDMYKYIHDQSLRLANQGLTPLEAAEIVELPDAIGKKWYNRYYHGGLHHNVRAVFHKELGFWDGDPATILPLLPQDNAQRHVALIGRDKILAEGRQRSPPATTGGPSRCCTTWCSPTPATPRPGTCKPTPTSSSATSRRSPVPGIFLTAAKELREGVVTEGQATTASQDTILAMPVDLLFDFAGVHLAGERAADVDIRVNLTFEGSGGDWTMWVRRGVLERREGHADVAHLTIAGPKAALAAVLLQPANAKAIIDRAGLKTDGDLSVLDTLASVTDTFDTHFNISTP